MNRQLIPLTALILAACSQETLAPTEQVAPTFSKAAPETPCFQGGAAFPGNDVVAGGLHHFPIGRALLSVDDGGHLVISNLHRSGNDGACTRLPGVNGVTIGIIAHEPAEAHTDPDLRIIARNGTQIFESSLRIRPNGRLAGYMDYTDDSCMNTVVVRHRGQLVRTTRGIGRVPFVLPLGMEMEEWSFTVGGIVTIRLKDPAGTAWSVTGTRDAACRMTPKLGAVVSRFGGAGPNSSVTLSFLP